MNKQTKGGEYMKNQYILAVVVAIVVGGFAFYGGMQYQKSQNRNYTANGTFGNGTGGNQRFGQNGGTFQGRGSNNSYRPVIGKIVSIDKGSITVETNDGSSKIIILSDSTTYVKTDKAVADDLKSGAQISVFGKQNSDGSVTAQNIQLNPIFRTQMNEKMPSPTQ